jgi:hypothetical protein
MSERRKYLTARIKFLCIGLRSWRGQTMATSEQSALSRHFNTERTADLSE